jgi:hypothetical protein
MISLNEAQNGLLSSPDLAEITGLAKFTTSAIFKTQKAFLYE